LAGLFPGVYYRTSLTPAFRLTNVGENIHELIGYRANELLAENTLAYLRFLHPGHDEILEKKKGHCVKSSDLKSIQYHILTKTRSTKLVEDYFVGEYDSNGNLIAINGYLREFRRESIRLKLQNQLEAYRAAIDVNIISSITDARGVIIYANENFKKISQFTDEELLGKTHRVVRSDYHPRSFFQEMWKTISSGQMWHGDILNKAKDGTLYWVATVIIPVFGDDNQISSYLSLRMLITERKRANEQREKYIRVLEEIAHVIAHDVRGPVCSILGLVDVVSKTDSPERDLKAALNYLTYSSKKLDEMTRELSAKIDSADREIKS
ncbi:MAG TPA: PAS domain-containing protein, partial [Nitrosomonas sp.]|nr:PAS domain-containing protein [Nitrosomonas sp.]